MCAWSLASTICETIDSDYYWLESDYYYSDYRYYHYYMVQVIVSGLTYHMHSFKFILHSFHMHECGRTPKLKDLGRNPIQRWKG